MTVSLFSTGSMTGPQLLLEAAARGKDAPQEAAKPRTSFAAIVASMHGHGGKTLLARVLADYFILSGLRPLIFDTDTTEQGLNASFPYDTVIADMGEVRDQMTLFDTLAAPSPESRVVDVTHQSLRRFFKVMLDSDFVAEAKASGIEPVIFYLVDRNPDSFEEALHLRDLFSECRFVLVKNAFIGEPKELTRRSHGYLALEDHEFIVEMPEIDPAYRKLLADPDLSLSDLMRQPLSFSDVTLDPDPDFTFDARAAVRSWLIAIFREIHRVTRMADARAGAFAER